MTNLSNELKVALTILAALLLGFAGYRVMSDLPVLRQSKIIYTYFERADGLTAGNYITINGVKVGSVKRLELTGGDSVRVTLSFDLNMEVPQGSVALIESSGLLDEKAITIHRGTSSEEVPYGGTIKGVYRGGMMETLKNEGEKISEDVTQSFEQLNQLLAELNEVMTGENRGKVEQVLTNLQSTTNEISGIFQHRREELESSIHHAQRFLANLDTVSTDNKSRVDSVLTGMESSLTEIKTLSQNLSQSNDQLQQILGKINNGEGSLGELVNNPALYNNLESLTANMDSLVQNINRDPRKYLKHMRLIEVF